MNLSLSYVVCAAFGCKAPREMDLSGFPGVAVLLDLCNFPPAEQSWDHLQGIKHFNVGLFLCTIIKLYIQTYPLTIHVACRVANVS